MLPPMLFSSNQVFQLMRSRAGQELDAFVIVPVTRRGPRRLIKSWHATQRTTYSSGLFARSERDLPVSRLHTSYSDTHYLFRL